MFVSENQQIRIMKTSKLVFSVLCSFLVTFSFAQQGQQKSPKMKEFKPKKEINTPVVPGAQADVPAASEGLEVDWITWEEAMEKTKSNPKKVFVDMYTSWCGWCKRMDATTFKDPKIVAYLNDNFYPVKFNAEQKKTIEFQGHQFKFVPNGRRGYHELANAMLNGRMGYPSFVLLDEEMARIMISPGYKKAEQMMPELEFAKEEQYKVMSFDDYKKSKT